MKCSTSGGESSRRFRRYAYAGQIAIILSAIAAHFAVWGAGELFPHPPDNFPLAFGMFVAFLVLFVWTWVGPLIAITWFLITRKVGK